MHFVDPSKVGGADTWAPEWRKEEKASEAGEEGRKGPYLKGKGLFSGVKFTKGREGRESDGRRNEEEG